MKATECELKYKYQRMLRLLELHGTVDKQLAGRFDLDIQGCVNTLRMKGYNVQNVGTGEYRLLSNNANGGMKDAD